MGARSHAPGPSTLKSKLKTGMTPNYNSQRVCSICGARDHHGPCPHQGKRFYSCGGGHLARICRAAKYRPNTYIPRLNYQDRLSQGNERHYGYVPTVHKSIKQQPSYNIPFNKVQNLLVNPTHTVQNISNLMATLNGKFNLF